MHLQSITLNGYLKTKRAFSPFIHNWQKTAVQLPHPHAFPCKCSHSVQALSSPVDQQRSSRFLDAGGVTSCFPPVTCSSTAIPNTDHVTGHPPLRTDIASFYSVERESQEVFALPVLKQKNKENLFRKKNKVNPFKVYKKIFLSCFRKQTMLHQIQTKKIMLVTWWGK